MLFYLLLAGGVVSGFTPVTYPARVSSECDQYDIQQNQQLSEALGQVQKQLDNNMHMCRIRDKSLIRKL